jgi:DNA polymerase III subunit chi
MPEVRFYALKRRPLDAALGEFLEEGLALGARIAVEAPDAERVEALDKGLWTYSDESFLPHGVAGADDAARQPVLIGTGPENGNAATWRVLVGGADPAPHWIDAACARLVLMFDDEDAAAKADARKRWAEAKAAGAAPSFWREGEEGGWTRSG